MRATSSRTNRYRFHRWTPQPQNFVQFHVVAPREDVDDIVRHVRCHGIGAGPLGSNIYRVEVVPFDTKLVEGMYKVQWRSVLFGGGGRSGKTRGKDGE